jgi:hypothetical protein
MPKNLGTAQAASFSADPAHGWPGSEARGGGGLGALKEKGRNLSGLLV